MLRNTSQVEEEDEEGLMSGLSATIIGTEMRQDKSKNKFTVCCLEESCACSLAEK